MIWDCQEDPEAVSLKQQPMWLYTSGAGEIHNKHTTSSIHIAAEEQVEKLSRETAVQFQAAWQSWKRVGSVTGRQNNMA